MTPEERWYRRAEPYDPDYGLPPPPLTEYRKRGAFWSRWAIYGALAFLAVVAVVLAIRSVG